ncbi:MAG TPA: hypothetical protein VF063_08115 [Gaiellaceae bacterium]
MRVKERYGDPRPLGDIDDAGASLLAAFSGFLENFESHLEGAPTSLRCLSSTVEGEELLAMFQHGQNGVAADIVGPTGSLRLRQRREDTSMIRSGAVFRLPFSDETGWLALHINNDRGIKTLLDIGLHKRFVVAFPELRFEIVPFVQLATLRTAVDRGEVAKVQLVKYERPTDKADAATSKWVRAGELARIELTVSSVGRGKRLVTDLLKRVMGGDDAAIGEIVEFEGMRFDEAKIVVVTETSARRTFYLERPAAGHPMTLDLEGLAYDDDDELVADTVFAGLRDALDGVG